jgi:hypothetical protein
MVDLMEEWMRYANLVFRKDESDYYPKFYLLGPDETEVGVVKWYAKWKEFVYAPFSASVYKRGILREIADFIDELDGHSQN